MKRLGCILAAAIALIAGAATAQDSDGIWSGRSFIGVGRLFNNDYIGDGHDRWRTGSYVLSVLTGDKGQTSASAPLELLEFRMRSEIVAPRYLERGGHGDRVYAGMLTFGAHTQWERDTVEYDGGLDLVFTGPKTGVSNFHGWFHDRFGATEPDVAVISTQLGNKLYPTLTGEVARTYEIGRASTVRPFVEATAGFEDIVRFGADLQIGQTASDIPNTRDSVTGQRYKLGESSVPGVSFVSGFDVAYVADSALFPASWGTEAEDIRYRARSGMNWQIGRNMSFFYGMTYLSKEFVGQDEGQIVGSLRLNFNF